MLARRCAWFRAQPDLDPERLVFIDETGASTKTALTGGTGQARPAAPIGRGKTTAFTGAVAPDRHDSANGPGRIDDG